MNNRWIGIILLIGGLVLVALGLNAAESFSSEVSEALEGTPSDKSLWFLIGGGVLALLGVGALLRRSPRS